MAHMERNVSRFPLRHFELVGRIIFIKSRFHAPSQAQKTHLHQLTIINHAPRTRCHVPSLPQDHQLICDNSGDWDEFCHNAARPSTTKKAINLRRRHAVSPNPNPNPNPSNRLQNNYINMFNS
jgi:hypothetical protein